LHPADRAPGFAAAPSRLFGREGEQRALSDDLSAAMVGNGRLVLIGGDAGIGKTALAGAICRAAHGQGALALIGRCYDLAETPPYGPWLELFARYPADVATPNDGLPPLPTVFAQPGGVGAVASQSVLFREVENFLTTLAARRPVVLLLDDLHWADPASLDLLRFVARLAATLPLLLLATYRTDELTRGHPLHRLLPLLVREARASRLDLRPLDADGARGSRMH